MARNDKYVMNLQYQLALASLFLPFLLFLEEPSSTSATATDAASSSRGRFLPLGCFSGCDERPAGGSARHSPALVVSFVLDDSAAVVLEGCAVGGESSWDVAEGMALFVWNESAAAGLEGCWPRVPSGITKRGSDKMARYVRRVSRT